MKISRSRKIFAGYYFCYFGGLACISSYLNVYLEKELGFNGTQLGIYTSLTAFLPAFLIPLIGYWSDKTARHKVFFITALGVQIASTALLSQQKTVLSVVTVGMMMEIAHFAVTPLADTQSTNFCTLTKSNYGLLRCGGSVGWVVFGMVTGFVVARSGAWNIIFPMACGVAVLAFLLGLTFPKTEKAANVSDAQHIGMKDVKMLVHNRPYLLVLLLSVQASVTTDTILAYIGNHLIVTLGAGASSISWNTAFCVIPEILLLPLSWALLPKLGYRKCYLISCGCLIVRFLIYSVAPNAQIFLLGSLLQGFTTCCATVVNLAYMKNTVSSSLFGTAVTLSFSAAAVGRAFFSFGFGQIYQHLGSRSIFTFVLILQVLMTILVWRTRLLDQPKTQCI